ncbi:EAL domain-containing protein [Candidatus Izemoplasma sp. B36]|uniref:EAL domain-containing protein n=1 Tax=Candidatus Izemoplasma sp. B36 TaxID=3242468 RepID=UPI0035582539
MKHNKRNPLYKMLIVGTLLIVLFEAFLYGFFAYKEQSAINDLYSKQIAIQRKIENVFQSTLTISDAYLSYISNNLDSLREETEAFLDHLLYYEENYIHNIATIEDTTIKYNYPYEENQTSIGVDLSTIPDQRDYILQVKNDEVALFIGPVELVQGGNAFILRIPIIDNQVYWGQIAVVINADTFNQLILTEAELNEICVNIYDNHSQDSVLTCESEVLEEESLTSQYTNKYISWDITISNLAASTNLLENIVFRIIGYSIIFVICFFVFKAKSLNDKILYNSTHDSLTGSYNRSKFISDYNEGLFNNMLISFNDINKFKLLNDTLGHSYGDWCLIQLSNRFRNLENFRTYRISGDEFILVSKIPMTINQFYEELPTNKFTFFSDEYKQNVELVISIGVLEKLTTNISLESILMYLDYAMYDSKNENRALTIVNKELMELYDDTKVMEQQLIDDIKQNKLIPYYQPIINLDAKKIEGFEVLSRWLYKGEIRTAAMFIPIVKKIKYVDFVDKNLFAKLQNEYMEMLEEFDKIDEFSFSVNLSAETLMSFEKDNRMFDKFVEDKKIPTEKIVFEVSEDMNLGLISIETLRYIQHKGYSISVDDFGAGVSKLSDVLSGELKTIKTDRSLLPIEKSHDRKASAFYTIIRTIKASDTLICVEGVETLQQLKLSRITGCNYAQGYLFSKPMPKEKVIEFIKNFNFSDYLKD